jgi:sigma-54 dependent transcriptional regulator, acetoin dehydrogenase operon transcriptional activator AcoR
MGRVAFEGTRWSAEAQRRIRRAREAILSAGAAPGGDAPELVRPEIAASWRRSLLSGVDPNRVPDGRIDPERSAAPRLLRPAEPVLGRLVGQLSGTTTAVVLADSKAWILWRGAGERALFNGLDRIAASPGCCLGEELVGTNGLGTVVEERRPSLIVGGEHYQDAMQDFTCVGVPIVDPLSNRLEGVLDLTCASRDTNELLLPLLTEAVREIELRLREQATARERALFEEFVERTRRRRDVAVASLNEDFLITNAAAAQLFEPADHALLWEWAGGAFASGREVSGELTLTREITVQARCTPVDIGGPRPAGVIVTMVPATDGGTRQATGSRTWRQVLRQVDRLATLDGPVLLHGESGVGKVRLATRLHAARGGTGPVRVLDCRVQPHQGAAWLDQLCAALDAADTTVVLRRLTDLPPEVQVTVAALVGSARARVVLTSVDPPGGDLLDVAAVVLAVPPLRDRAEDVPVLVEELLAELVQGGNQPRCTASALGALKAHPWPGNVRELRRVLATALVNCMHFDISTHHLPEGYRSPPDRPRLALLETTERDAICAALQKAGWNKERAAADLGISRATIYRKVRRFGIAPPASGKGG